jgi:hypothetical protein
MRPVTLDQIPTPVAAMIAIAVLAYMSIAAFLALRGAIRVSDDLWHMRISLRRGVPMATAAWAVGLGGAHVVAQLWANGLAWLAAAAG